MRQQTGLRLRDRIPLYSEMPRPGDPHQLKTISAWVSSIIALLILIGCAWTWIKY